jgi:hypothetical protein
MNQLNRISSPFKEYGINQSNAYINRDNMLPMQNNGYYNNNINNHFSYLTTPKKNYNLYDPDNLFSPFDSNYKNEITNNYLLTNRKNSLNQLTPFTHCNINNSPYNGMKSENKV